jgi:excisionase family DNA binding protein
MLHMERDDPRGAEPTTNNPAESADEGDEGSGARGEERVDVAESSGYTTTKQAAKALGVSRRTVQSYVRRGELEAFVEGEGVEKTFFVSIDSLDALRERRRVTREGSPRIADNTSSGSAGSGFTAKAAQAAQSIGAADAPELIEIVQDLQYRLGRAEAQVELTARTESTLREQLAREQERADRLEAELREARPSGTKPPPETRDAPETAQRRSDRGTAPEDAQEPAQRRERSWWRRFFGFE